MINNTINVPEITAKAYADINGLAVDKVNSMCYTGALPCRKINGDNKVVPREDRGTWWVNLVQLKQQLKK